MFSLNKRRVVTTFFFIFSTRCSLFISSLTEKIRKLFFSRCFFILYIIVFFFFDFLQLSSLINIIIRRDRDRRRRRVYFALSARLRRDSVCCQNDNDFRCVALDIIQFNVHLFQR